LSRAFNPTPDPETSRRERVTAQFSFQEKPSVPEPKTGVAITRYAVRTGLTIFYYSPGGELEKSDFLFRHLFPLFGWLVPILDHPLNRAHRGPSKRNSANIENHGADRGGDRNFPQPQNELSRFEDNLDSEGRKGSSEGHDPDPDPNHRDHRLAAGVREKAKNRSENHNAEKRKAQLQESLDLVGDFFNPSHDSLLSKNPKGFFYPRHT